MGGVGGGWWNWKTHMVLVTNCFCVSCFYFFQTLPQLNSSGDVISALTSFEAIGVFVFVVSFLPGGHFALVLG